MITGPNKKMALLIFIPLISLLYFNRCGCIGNGVWEEAVKEQGQIE